jgi:hypothetical protein
MALRMTAVLSVAVGSAPSCSTTFTQLTPEPFGGAAGVAVGTAEQHGKGIFNQSLVILLSLFAFNGRLVLSGQGGGEYPCLTTSALIGLKGPNPAGGTLNSGLRLIHSRWISSVISLELLYTVNTRSQTFFWNTISICRTSGCTKGISVGWSERSSQL